MALATEIAVRRAIQQVLLGVPGIGKVYPRYRRPLNEGRDEEFARLYVDSDKQVNVWMIRRLQRQPLVDEHNNLVSVTQVYQLLGHRGVVDSEDDDLASEARFQELIEAIAEAFEQNPTLGLDGVTHRALQIPSDIVDGFLGSIFCHIADCRLLVDVEDC